MNLKQVTIPTKDIERSEGFYKGMGFTPVRVRIVFDPDISNREEAIVMNVGIYVYDHAEVLDFSGPFEVFSTASRVCEDDEDPFSVFLIGERGGAVTARAGFSVNPAYGIADHPAIDLLIVPGGIHDGEMTKPRVIDWIARKAAKAKLVASVCTGAFLLAKAGVAVDQNVTTHWDDIEDLRDQFPRLTVHENRRWVDEGRIVTSAGISAGIDMSLHLVSRLHSEELAERTARRMEFDRSAEAGDR